MMLKLADVLAAICICLMVSHLSFPTASRGQSIEGLQWGPLADGLQLSLSTVESARRDVPELQVAFRNAGDRDVTLNLGYMLANGKEQVPDKIKLDFTDGEGKTRTFKFFDKQHGGIAGRVDDYVVPLRSGSMYTLRLTIDQFWCHETKEFELKLRPGRNQFTARFEGAGTEGVNLDMPGMKLMNFWLGKVQSNTLAVES
jgi:hypothetical protein